MLSGTSSAADAFDTRRRAGRAYAAYGGIYIVTSIAWLAVVERIRPLGSDWIGVGLCVLGATIILLGPRFSNP